MTRQPVPVDLEKDSLLWLINRVVFHPRGYALTYDPETGEFTLLGDGTEPWVFANFGAGEAHHLQRTRELMP
jgi:hypothetical protein